MRKDRSLSGLWLVVLFALLLGGAGAWLLFGEQETFSENENRVLMTRPAPSLATITSGSFQEDFADFTCDQFPARDALTGVASLTKVAFGRRDLDGAYIGREGGAIRLYEKTDDIPPARAQTTLAALADYLDALGEEAPPCVFALVPEAGEVYPEGLPRPARVFDGEVLRKEAREVLDDRAVVIDLLPDLTSAKGSGSLYYRTDHHWTARGVAAAYPALCRALGLSPLDGAGEAVTVTRDFSGTLAAKVLLPALPRDEVARPAGDFSRIKVSAGSGFAGAPLAEIPLFDEAALQKKDKYAYFLGGNPGVVSLENESLPKDAGTLLVIKDSFANAMAPLLARHYRRVVLVDPRYFRGNLRDLADETAPDALLFLYESANFARDTSVGVVLRSARNFSASSR